MSAPVRPPELPIDRIREAGVVPVVRIASVDEALRVSDALMAGGLDVIEITFRTNAAAAAIEALATERPDMLVLAGTVLDAETARAAIDRGCHLVVSPCLDPEVVGLCQALGTQVIPGVSTPTEVQAARRLGLRVLKLFPADLLGGVKWLGALGAVYPDVGFVPTGGVDADSLAEYLAAPNVVACGGSWLVHPSLIGAGRYDRITTLTGEALTRVAETRRDTTTG